MRRFAGFCAALVVAVCFGVFASPVRADTELRVAVGLSPGLDPARASSYADAVALYNIYDTLVLPAQGAPGHRPHVAKSWSGGGTSYTFVLRDDVSFHSGNALTADDVVFSLERMQALDGELAYLFEPVKSAKAIDAHTVQFDLRAPYAPFISALVRLPIVDKTLVMAHLDDGAGTMKDWGQGFLSSNSAGSGAYRVDSHDAEEGTVLAKNTDYFLALSDKVPARVSLLPGLDTQDVVDRFKQGTLDISSQWLPPDALKTLADNGADLLTASGGGGFYIKLNTQKAPLDDPECRLALSKAFNYEAARATVSVTADVSFASPSTGAIPVGMLGANPPSAVLKRDMTAAKRHIGACRYPPGEIELEIAWIGQVPVEKQLAELMQSNFTELGVTTRITNLSWADFVERATEAETTPHISQVLDISETGDPDALLYGMYNSAVGGTWRSAEHLDDDRVDALLEQGRTAGNAHERANAYRALNARLLEIAPTIYAYDRISVFAVDTKVSVPALSDPEQRFEVEAMGLTFRLMEVQAGK